MVYEDKIFDLWNLKSDVPKEKLVFSVLELAASVVQKLLSARTGLLQSGKSIYRSYKLEEINGQARLVYGFYLRRKSAVICSC
jgi:hypothetical protein